VETEERDERGSGRSQNVVHTLPRSMASVPQFLTGPLERIDPAEGSTQVLVITADAETAVALAEAVLRMTGPAGIELLPITTARRAKRLMAGRPVLAAAGSPRDIRDLLRGSDLKLDTVKSVVIAWADEILNSGEDEVEALELVMNELPKDAARIVVTSRSEGRVNAFAERYLRRARRDVAEESDETTEPVAIQYVTVSSSSRSTALRRLLDDMDPPSAAIIVSSDASERDVSALLRTLGYGEGKSSVRVSRGEIEPST
jgi:ATP-dependent RNA helicase DeaD